MKRIFYFFIYALLYTEIILHIHINNKIFIKKIENKKINLKLEDIKRENDYLASEIEIIENKKLKDHALSE
jgi:hypothetical protein